MSPVLLLAGLAWAAAPPVQPAPEPPAAEAPAPAGPSETEIADLAVLGRVWAFLQWHHPRFVDGTRDADDALLEVLPAVRSAGGRDARNAVLVEWIDGLGPVEPSGATLPEGTVHLRPDLSWMEDTDTLGDALVQRLAAVYAARADRTGAPIGAPAKWVGNPELKGMRPHDEKPDASMRLLGLFRYWSIVQWLSPYRDLTTGWDALLTEQIPRAIAADSRGAWLGTMQRMAMAVGDSHTTVPQIWSWVEPQGDCILPASMRFLDEDLVVWEPFPGSPFHRGDVVTRIGETPVKTMLPESLRWTSGSNLAARRRDAVWVIGRGPCGPVDIEVARPEAVTLTVERVEPGRGAGESRKARIPHSRSGPALQQLGERVVYLKLADANDAEMKAYVKAVRRADGLVLDARGYPSASVGYGVAPHLVSEPTVFAVFTTVPPQNPGWTVFTDDARLQPASPHIDVPVVVLIDEGSQSAAEFQTMAFAAGPRTTLVGSPTAGADGNISDFPLPGGVGSTISGIGVFWPDRTPTQQVGLKPDRAVVPTAEGIRAGRDELLEVALEILAPGLDPGRRREMALRPAASASP